MTFNLSIAQALDVYEDLIDAYHGDNKYGGYTAEVYAYRLMPYMTSAAEGTEIWEEGTHKCQMIAAENLYDIVDHFIANHDGCRVFIDGKKFGIWVSNTPFVHRYHIEITRKK